MDQNMQHSRRVATRFLKFSTIGAVSSATYVVFVAIIIELIKASPTEASVAAYALALPISYFGNRSFTYLSKRPVKLEFPRYVTVHATNLAIAAISMWFVVEQFGLSYWIGSCLAVLFAPISTFILLELWVFGGQEIRNQSK